MYRANMMFIQQVWKWSDESYGQGWKWPFVTITDVNYDVNKMANALVVSDFSSKYLDDKLIINDVSDCEFCLNMKRELQIMQEGVRFRT